MLILTGGTWTASTAPSGDLNPPPNSFDFIQPTDVSCPATGFCVAVGSHFDASSQGHVMAVSEVDATSAQVACLPAADDLQQATSCTATATDLAASGASSPSGTVAFSSDSSGTLSNASACTLSATTADASSCSLSYTPTAVGSGTHTITAAHAGDPTHGASSGTYGLTVTDPQASVTPTSLNFGKVPARKTSEQTVTISDGAAATGNLIIGGIADSGAPEFTIDWATSTCTDPVVTAPSLAPGQSCTVVEKFGPTKSTNAKTGVGGTLTVTDDDPTTPRRSR